MVAERNGLTRRDALKCVTGVFALAAGHARGQVAAPAGAEANPWGALRDRLRPLMAELVKAAQLRQGGVVFTRPCVSETYRGVWPDDCMWPYVADPALAAATEWPGLLEWLTDAIVELPCVPDRVEFNGVAVMSPGGARGAPMSLRMPLHLPSAWTRYLDYARSFGVAIPRQAEWAQVIRRSFDQVPFSFGLVHSDPQTRVVGFGFHDSIRITGLELMTSLVTYRGLQRAAALFADDLEPAVTGRWRRQAEGIRANLHRLFDAKLGGFLGGTLEGRQVSVWGSGLAYALATEEQRAAMVRFLQQNKADIFLRGCTRQVASAGGWSGKASGYQNDGFWATGTGFVLPALAEGDPAFARELAETLVDQLTQFDVAEWLNAQGQPHGARRFLASVSMPLLALRALAERRPLLDYF